MIRAAGRLCVGLVLLASATAAQAVVPGAQKLAEALADANRAGQRTEPLILEVKLSIGGSEPLASGVLASHPSGLARLELRSPRGFVERHLLQGNEYAASRDGQPLDDPRPFLPPMFLLQSSSGAALRAALSSFGVASADVELGLCGDRDCYVLGGRVPAGLGGEEQRLPSLWIDMDTLEVVQIDRRDGVRFRFGPHGAFDGVQAPSWISIEVPGEAAARLEIVGVAPASAPAAAFGTDWLTGEP